MLVQYNGRFRARKLFRGGKEGFHGPLRSKMVNSSRASTNSLEEVLEGKLEADPKAAHSSKKRNYLVMASTAASAAKRAPSM
jgi:hypothetical protein